MSIGWSKQSYSVGWAASVCLYVDCMGWTSPGNTLQPIYTPYGLEIVPPVRLYIDAIGLEIASPACLHSIVWAGLHQPVMVPVFDVLGPSVRLSWS